jgi:hypothetical protein
MKKLSWAVAPVVFLAFFGIYSFRLGIQPELMHDDFEYTYPAFSLVERGNFGSPLLGPGLNIENRTYNLIVYYYATVHAVLIRIFGDGPQSIPLANTFHFGLLAAAGAFFLWRRQAFLGLLVFLYALVSDERMVSAARHGRPEMTAGFCLAMGVLALWLRLGEGRRHPAVLFGMSAALTAGMLSHTSVVFFAAALLLVFAVPLARQLRWRDAIALLLPYLTIPLLYGYFVLTDSLENIVGQVALAQGDLRLTHLLKLAASGQWDVLASLTSEFLHTHAWQPGLWLGLAACLVVPAVAPGNQARGARFFAGVYVLSFLVHYLCLKHFVLSYRVIYQATLYLGLALLAEALTARLGERLGNPSWATALRLAGSAVLLGLTVGAVSRFRGSLLGEPLPYARLQGVLTHALMESGARPGDRVLLPSPFGFHLRRKFDVIAQPASKYNAGRWSPSFREKVREIWGAETLRNVDPVTLCTAMGLAHVRPTWVVAWNGDYSVMMPFWEFLKRFPGLPGVSLSETRRADLPRPYGGTVRVYRLGLSAAYSSLDRTPQAAPSGCP